MLYKNVEGKISSMPVSCEYVYVCMRKAREESVQQDKNFIGYNTAE